jgi:hypothetical protein
MDDIPLGSNFDNDFKSDMDVIDGPAKTGKYFIFDAMDEDWYYGPHFTWDSHGCAPPFLEATKIREVYLGLDLDDLMDKSIVWHIIVEFPFWLQGFKDLSKLTVQIPALEWMIDTGMYKRNVGTILRRIRRKVRVQGEFFGIEYEDIDAIIRDETIHCSSMDGMPPHRLVLFYWMGLATSWEPLVQGPLGFLGVCRCEASYAGGKFCDSKNG